VPYSSSRSLRHDASGERASGCVASWRGLLIAFGAHARDTSGDGAVAKARRARRLADVDAGYLALDYLGLLE
jgi:hypothetical protein